MNTFKPSKPICFGSYIAGFVDGEGSFYTSLRQRSDFECNWKFDLCFTIANNDPQVLLFCKKHLGCGEIRQTTPSLAERKKVAEMPLSSKRIKETEKFKQSEKFVYEISALNKLEKYIIPFFTKHPFVSTKKRYEFRVFKLLVKLFKEYPSKNSKEFLDRFLKLRKALGKYRTEKLKNTDEVIQLSFKPH